MQGDKKAKKGGKKAKDAAPAADVEGPSIEELNQKIVTLEKEKTKEEEYRNYMQLERVRMRRAAAREGGCVLHGQACRCIQRRSKQAATSRPRESCPW